MAPLAISPRTLRELAPAEHRRWMVAAAITGAMLSSDPMVRADRVLEQLPSSWGAEDPGAGTERAATPAPPTAVAATTVSSTTAAGDRDEHDERDEREGEGESGGPDGHVGDGALPDGIVELARAGEVRIVTEGSAVELVGFHESSSAAALRMTPAHPVVSEHAGVAADASGDEGPVMVLPTRGRAGAPTSAIDLAVAPGMEVAAPVTGEVVEVADFSLYGRTRDVLVRIRAADDPTVIITAMHLVDPLVEVGARVEGGVTPIATSARQLPFDSQIDRFTAAYRGQAGPHVHLEVRAE
jgi:murein DD-endopeptidase MepM/ murein hydrolase activator NlpD